MLNLLKGTIADKYVFWYFQNSVRPYQKRAFNLVNLLPLVNLNQSYKLVSLIFFFSPTLSYHAKL